MPSAPDPPEMSTSAVEVVNPPPFLDHDDHEPDESSDAGVIEFKNQNNGGEESHGESSEGMGNGGGAGEPSEPEPEQESEGNNEINNDRVVDKKV